MHDLPPPPDATPPLPDYTELSPPSLPSVDFLPFNTTTDIPYTREAEPPTFQRVQDTPVGPITIVRPPTSAVSHSTQDLAELLDRTRPQTLQLVTKDNRVYRNLRFLPGRDFVVRWNEYDARSETHTPEAVVEHMRVYEREVERLQQLGIRMLERTVFIVEHDKHHENYPTVYTIVPRHSVSEPLRTPRQEIRAAAMNPRIAVEPITTDIDIHLEACAISAAYYGQTPYRGHCITDALSSPTQFAKDGTWLDYDTRTADNARETELELTERWARRLPVSRPQRDLIKYIESIPWRQKPWYIE